MKENKYNWIIQVPRPFPTKQAKIILNEVLFLQSFLLTTISLEAHHCDVCSHYQNEDGLKNFGVFKHRNLA